MARTQGHGPTTKRQACSKKKKRTISVEELCDGLPKEFARWFHHVHSLRFGDEPGYRYLRRVFRNLFTRERFKNDNVFDWTVLKFLMTQNGSRAARSSIRRLSSGVVKATDPSIPTRDLRKRRGERRRQTPPASELDLKSKTPLNDVDLRRSKRAREGYRKALS